MFSRPGYAPSSMRSEHPALLPHNPKGSIMDEQPAEPVKPVWWKRKWVLVTAGIIAIIVVIGIAAPKKNDEKKKAVAHTKTAVSTIPATPSMPPVVTVPSTTTVATTTVPATTTIGETVAQENAREKASSYLEFAAFSRSGLIGQLGFDGFSPADSTYAVDALHVDWNQQAAKKAASYLEFTSFSRSGLIGQLKFDGFSQAEAEYGVGTTGL